MIDRSTKILLGVIAAGLWANVLMPVLSPAPARADVEGSLSRIDSNIRALTSGVCINGKLC
jgi:hypothetical protein